MPTPLLIRLGLQDEQVKVGDHIAYFWETADEFSAGVHFLEVGLDLGDCCVIFGHDEGNRRVRERLVDRGYNCDRLEARGSLIVVPGHPSASQMLENIATVFTAAINRGASLIRLLGNIGWGREGWPSELDILEFEAKVTGAAKQFPCVVVCMYDVRALPGRVLVHGAFETHPLTFCGNVMRQNTHYVSITSRSTSFSNGCARPRTRTNSSTRIRKAAHSAPVGMRCGL